MADVPVITYGPGGTDRPNNIVSQGTTPVPDDITNSDAMRTKAANAINALEFADTNWSTITAGQKDAALQLTVRVAAKLARLAVGRLDGQ